MASNASQVVTSSQGSKYTKEQKRAFIANYVVLGNIKKAAELSNMPARTCTDWIKSDWGQSLIAEVHSEKSAELDANLSHLIERATNHVLDSLEHGDEKLDKNNEIIRLRMDGKAAATVMGIAFDKRQISRNLPTSINTSMDNAALTKLQQQFQQLSKQSKVIEGETLDNESD